MPKAIPSHLKPYVVKQDYTRYTAQDHAVWRYSMRQLKSFLSTHAHPCYVDGLKRTGITTDRIPKIKDMDKKLRRFGWGAVPVSGFIPPAAFMEFQSLGYLPIASEVRTIEHIHYTPAPDIVHEAAGHAPIIVDKQFSNYLQQYAEVAAKAIITQEDLDIYEAIRNLSDAKELPNSTPQLIARLNDELADAVSRQAEVSEAGYLSRMNWWTAEYGLIGSSEEPKLYGAGLLSSIGEARNCIQPKVKKIPMSIDCIKYTYDITEQQPQLFVTPDFQSLSKSLKELADQMSFRQGGLFGLKKAQTARTVNTVEFDSGVQMSGKLTEYIDHERRPVYIRFTGPTQLAYGGVELPNQGKRYHKEGYSTPVGQHSLPKLKLNSETTINYDSGVQIKGTLKKVIKKKGKPILLQLKPCKVTYNGQTLYDPSWGPFDLALGSKVTSVYGGPADRSKFGKIDNFVAKKIPKKKYSKKTKQLFQLHKEIQKLRDAKYKKTLKIKKLIRFIDDYETNWQDQWLVGLELYELALQLKYDPDLTRDLRSFSLSQSSDSVEKLLVDGLAIADRKL